MKYERLVDAITDYIYEEAGELTLPEVLGVLEVVKLQITRDIEDSLDKEELT
jgi:hypothetical protein